MSNIFITLHTPYTGTSVFTNISQIGCVRERDGKTIVMVQGVEVTVNETVSQVIDRITLRQAKER